MIARPIRIVPFVAGGRGATPYRLVPYGTFNLNRSSREEQAPPLPSFAYTVRHGEGRKGAFNLIW